MARSLSLALVAVLLTAGCQNPKLFYGTVLDGWVIESGGDFSVKDGVLLVNKGTGWLR